MIDDQMLREVGAWLVDTDPEPPDASECVREAMARAPQVRQRGRHWPLPILDRSADSPTIGETTDYLPTAIPATNGHTPRAIGRTQSMLSPAKAITAAALAFALGGVLFIAEPFQQQGSVPGAATDLMDPARFTADAVLQGPYVRVRCEPGDGVLDCRDEFQMAVDATDPRASGTLTYGLNRDEHQYGLDAGGPGFVRVHAGTVTVENDDGMWVGTFTGYWDERGGRIFHAELAGQGGYEGWTMLLDDFCECNSPTSVMQGVIIPGDLPPTG